MKYETIQRGFLAILRREPREQEVRVWTRAEREPAALHEALLRQATEVRSIARLYQILLGEMPDGLTPPLSGRDGLTFWTSTLRKVRESEPGSDYKTALAHTIKDWFQAEAYKKLYHPEPDLPELMQKLCQTGLGRLPLADEVKEWSELPRGDASRRAGLAVAISETRACKQRLNPQIDAQLLRLAQTL